ncbi:MAG: hypothetical protein KBC65_05965 [Polaromonas sp.]|nr:hypothetical protein [Polaromonas sp.]
MNTCASGYLSIENKEELHCCRSGAAFAMTSGTPSSLETKMTTISLESFAAQSGVAFGTSGARGRVIGMSDALC